MRWPSIDVSACSTRLSSGLLSGALEYPPPPPPTPPPSGA